MIFSLMAFLKKNFTFFLFMGVLWAWTFKPTSEGLIVTLIVITFGDLYFLKQDLMEWLKGSDKSK